MNRSGNWAYDWRARERARRSGSSSSNEFLVRSAAWTALPCGSVRTPPAPSVSTRTHNRNRGSSDSIHEPQDACDQPLQAGRDIRRSGVTRNHKGEKQKLDHHHRRETYVRGGQFSAHLPGHFSVQITPSRKTTGMFDYIGDQMFCRVAAFHIQGIRVADVKCTEQWALKPSYLKIGFH